MTESEDENQGNDVLPSEMRRAVTPRQNQFQLPATLVTEVGFQSSRTDCFRGAKVAWYYHEKHDKAVLGNADLDSPALELVGVCRLVGVSDEGLAAGDVDGARVTIISDLPDPLYERLTRDEVVLKPVFTGSSTELDVPYVSVYPAREYDRGALPNVDRELRVEKNDDGTKQVESHHSHTNSRD